MKEVKKMKRQAFGFEIPQKRRGLKRNITSRKKKPFSFHYQAKFLHPFTPSVRIMGEISDRKLTVSLRMHMIAKLFK